MLLQEVGNIDGITTFFELATPLVARLAERLGLPGHAPAAIDVARDKKATRTVGAGSCKCNTHAPQETCSASPQVSIAKSSPDEHVWRRLGE